MTVPGGEAWLRRRPSLGAEARAVVNTWRPLTEASRNCRSITPRRRGRLPEPRTRAWCARECQRHPEPRASALQPLPTSEAQAPLQTVSVAPRTLSLKWSSVIKGVLGSVLPQAHVALGKTERRPQGDAHPASMFPSSGDTQPQTAGPVSHHPPQRQKRIHNQISREIVKSRLLLTVKLPRHGGSLHPGKR